MDDLFRDQIIEIEDQYEADWQGHFEWNTLQMREVMRSLPKELQQLVFLPLAEIELGRDWMWWSEWVQANHKNQSPEAVLSGLRSRSNGHAMLSLGIELGFPIKVAEEQIHFWEFHARSNWGDSPCELSFLGRAQKRSTLKPGRMFAVRRQPNVDWSKFPLHSETVFGRQENAKAFINQPRLGPTQSCFSFADHLDRRISRQQFSVSVLSSDFALLSNGSSVNPLFSSAGTLESGSRKIVSFPFRLQVLEFEFKFT